MKYSLESTDFHMFANELFNIFEYLRYVIIANCIFIRVI